MCFRIWVYRILEIIIIDFLTFVESVGSLFLTKLFDFIGMVCCGATSFFSSILIICVDKVPRVHVT